MKLATALSSALALSLSVLIIGCDNDTQQTTTGDPPAEALTGKDLQGEWVTEGCEAYPNGMGGESYLTRDFTLTETTWHLDLVIFGDKDCSFPLFSVAIDGPYTLGGLSAKVDGATEGEFAYTSNVWTALDASMVDVFNQAGCGAGNWAVGAPQEVGGTGCIGFAHKVSECPQEYDIVAIDGGALFFGERITDMCKEEGRPAALGAYSLAKQ